MGLKFFSPPDSFKIALWDILELLVYVGGIAFIESFLRPLIEGTGASFMVGVFLTISDIGMVICLLVKVVEHFHTLIIKLHALVIKVMALISDLKKSASEDDDDD
jgi:hypothetical protein